MTEIVFMITGIRTDFIEVSKSHWNLAVVSQNVLDGCLGAVHHSVGDPLSQTRLRLSLLLDPEVEDDWLDGDALMKSEQLLIIVNTESLLNQPAHLEEDGPVDHG